VHGILAFITRLTSFCLQSLHHRFVDWIKPSNTALMLGSLADLASTKPELVAENALLRQQLVILNVSDIRCCVPLKAGFHELVSLITLTHFPVEGKGIGNTFHF
jgi:hypothetical protein